MVDKLEHSPAMLTGAGEGRHRCEECMFGNEVGPAFAGHLGGDLQLCLLADACTVGADVDELNSGHYQECHRKFVLSVNG